MLVSTKGRYALRLMVYVAQAGDGAKVALREVAEREDISFKYLEQLARPLVQAGLLRSVRGKGGGYVLASDPAAIRAGTCCAWWKAARLRWRAWALTATIDVRACRSAPPFVSGPVLTRRSRTMSTA